MRGARAGVTAAIRAQLQLFDVNGAAPGAKPPNANANGFADFD